MFEGQVNQDDVLVDSVDKDSKMEVAYMDGTYIVMLITMARMIVRIPAYFVLVIIIVIMIGMSVL